MEYKDAGNAAFRNAEWAKALELYSRALEISPGLTAARANRAACQIQLQNWQLALEDCDLALQDAGINDQLRLKVVWRKAMSMRNLGEDERGWQAVVQHGLSLDPGNEKLQEESQYIFVKKVDTMPSQYTANYAAGHATSHTTSSTGHTGHTTDPEMQASSIPSTNGTAKQDFLPSLPLTYNGVLQLIRSQTPQTYEFWYTKVSGRALEHALARSGVEPDTLDYVFSMIASHPDQKQRNLEYMAALQASPRYEMTLFMADSSLHAKAMEAVSD